VTASGALPAGVTFDTVSRVLSGTPAAGTAGAWPLTFTATNGTSPNAVQNFTLTINNPAAANKLANPSFEVDVNGWTNNSKFSRSTTVAPHEGVSVGRFNDTSNGGLTIFQTVTGLSGGTAYLFSGWANIPAQNDNSFTFKFDVRWLNASNQTISTTTIKKYTAGTPGWDQASKSLVAPAGTTHAQVRMVATSLNGALYVDDLLFR
jgi:hypothetical protein